MSTAAYLADKARIESSLALEARDREAMAEVAEELLHVRTKFLGVRYNSAHEAYGVLAEEVDEFWDEVKKKRSKRDPAAMRAELKQIAAVAIRAMTDLGGA